MHEADDTAKLHVGRGQLARDLARGLQDGTDASVGRLWPDIEFLKDLEAGGRLLDLDAQSAQILLGRLLVLTVDRQHLDLPVPLVHRALNRLAGHGSLGRQAVVLVTAGCLLIQLLPALLYGGVAFPTEPGDRVGGFGGTPGEVLRRDKRSGGLLLVGHGGALKLCDLVLDRMQPLPLR